MSTAKCLVVVVEDRHADVEVKVFAGASPVYRALDYASRTAKAMARNRPEDVAVSLNRYQEAAGYIWFANVGPEGDCVRVQELPLDVG